MAANDMERPAPRHDSSGDFNAPSARGTGTLAVPAPRSSRDAHAPPAREVITTSTRRGSREEVVRSGGGGGVGGGGTGSSRGGGYPEDGGSGRGGRVEDDRPSRVGSRSGMSRGKRGRSVDSDRGSGGGGHGMGFDGDYEEGDPSQAFDSKRMRQPDVMPASMPLPMEEGPVRPSIDSWSRGYAGQGVEDGGRSSRGYGSGGGVGGRMQISMREMHMERPSYDTHGRGGGRAHHMDGGGMDGGGNYRDSRGLGMSDDDVDSRGGKKGRHDTGRSSTSRGGEDLDGGGRKDKKKSKKSRSSKDKRKN